MQSDVRKLEVTPLSHSLQAIVLGLSAAIYDVRLRIRGSRSLFLAATLLALALGVPVSAFAQCGGNGPRACCNGDGEFAHNPLGLLACDEGLSYSAAAGFTDPNGCSCSGGIISLACNSGFVQIPGTCGPEDPAACVCGGLSEKHHLSR
jgi:hypothetical protein